uniref:(northern house mosquito) hypothetical protein n=1 Tax=Culex pipiens TaxID=7175 RepID=A0A8D8GGF5_CULPI
MTHRSIRTLVTTGRGAAFRWISFTVGWTGSSCGISRRCDPPTTTPYCTICHGIRTTRNLRRRGAPTLSGTRTTCDCPARTGVSTRWSRRTEVARWRVGGNWSRMRCCSRFATAGSWRGRFCRTTQSTRPVGSSNRCTNCSRRSWTSRKVPGSSSTRCPS